MKKKLKRAIALLLCIGTVFMAVPFLIQRVVVYNPEVGWPATAGAWVLADGGA